MSPAKRRSASPASAAIASSRTCSRGSHDRAGMRRHRAAHRVVNDYLRSQHLAGRSHAPWTPPVPGRQDPWLRCTATGCRRSRLRKREKRR
jgi:hypothetical protein